MLPTERILRNSTFTITKQILRGNWKSERDDFCSAIFYEPQKRAYGDGSSWMNPRGPNNRVPQELPTHLQTLTSTSLPFSVSCFLSLCHSISFPLPFNNPVLRHRVITTRSTMGGNHWRLFTATSSSRQLISVEPISFLKETTQELPMDEHKSSNPSCRPSFCPPFASCY